MTALMNTAQLRASIAPPPDPAAVFWSLCDRCDVLIHGRGISRECVVCALAAQKAGMTPIYGEVSGT